MKKEFTLRLDDAACAELENLKKLSGEKTDAKAIRFAIPVSYTHLTLPTILLV